MTGGAPCARIIRGGCAVPGDAVIRAAVAFVTASWPGLRTIMIVASGACAGLTAGDVIALDWIGVALVGAGTIVGALVSGAIAAGDVPFGGRPLRK